MHGARGPSGTPLAFCTTLALPFRSEGGVILLSPLECEQGSLGLGKVAGRAPKPLHGARGPSGAPLAFYTPLAHEGLFAKAPLGVSLGHGVSARLQEGLPSLLMEQRAVRSSPGFLYDPRASFSLGRRGCFAEPPRVRTGVARSRQSCKKSPLASTRGERSVGGSPDFFLYDPHASFSLGRRGGMCQATLGGHERWHFW